MKSIELSREDVSKMCNFPNSKQFLIFAAISIYVKNGKIGQRSYWMKCIE